MRIGVGSATSVRAESANRLVELFSRETLVSFGLDGRTVPRLADRVSWQDGNRTLRIQLPPNATFHSGEPLTSRAVAAAIQKARPLTQGFEIGFENLQAIETPTDSEIVFRLSRPDSFLLSALSVIDISTPKHSEIGTGPFKLVGQQPTTLERYDGYYRGRAGIDQIVIKSYDSQRQAWAGMLRGDVDMLQAVANDSAEFLEGVSSIRTFTTLRPFYVFLGFNLRHPVLKNAAVRRAVTEAIDRQRIVNDALRGRGRVVDDPIWPFHWAYGESTQRHAYNVEAARAALDAANLPVAPTSSPELMPRRFQFTCLIWGEDPQFERMALMVQRDLANVGVDMVLDALDMTALAGRLKAGAFDAVLFQTNGGRTFDRVYQTWHSPTAQGAPMINSGYAGADRALERVRAAHDESETRLAVAELRARFYEDAPAVFLGWPETVRAVNNEFSFGDREADIFASVWAWRRQPASPTRASR